MSKPKRMIKPIKWQICTEGITEANYLKKYIEHLGITEYVNVNCPECAKKGCGRQHESLLTQMEKCGRSWQREKEWLVHDFDEGDRDANKRKSFDATYIEKQDDPNFSVIYSIPCFEYWLLLHNNPYEADWTKEICQDKAREFVNVHLAKQGKPPLRSDDFKSNPNLYDYFGCPDTMATAKRNAERRFADQSPQSGTRCSEIRPSTNMYELLDALRALAEKIKPLP